MPADTSPPDIQAQWDAETLHQFRARLTRLAKIVRDKQAAEQDARETLKEQTEVRRSAQAELTRYIEGDGVDAEDAPFIERLQVLVGQLDQAVSNETAARQQLGQLEADRRDARYRMETHIRTYLAPQPLFDRRADHG
jgi:leucyl-tRNA synthetase